MGELGLGDTSASILDNGVPLAEDKLRMADQLLWRFDATKNGLLLESCRARLLAQRLVKPLLMLYGERSKLLQLPHVKSFVTYVLRSGIVRAAGQFIKDVARQEGERLATEMAKEYLQVRDEMCAITGKERVIFPGMVHRGWEFPHQLFAHGEDAVPWLQRRDLAETLAAITESAAF